MPTTTTAQLGSEMPGDERHDAELVHRVRSGDRTSFTLLVRRHGGPLLRFARMFVRDESVAEEVVQDTWVAVLDGLDGFEERASFKTWLFRILANRARTRATREGRTVPFSALAANEDEPAVSPERFDHRDEWSDPPAAWNHETPEWLAMEAETRTVIERAVAALPPPQRAVLVLRDQDGLGTDDICNVLGITVTNQRVLLHRARARVRQAVEDHIRGR